MTNVEGADYDHVPRFRDIEPVELWSAVITPNVSYPDFLLSAVQVSEAAGGFRFTGFITMNQHGIVESFTGTRYPRTKYGIGSDDECNAAMDELASDFGSQVAQEVGTKQGVRVVMGLLEGYDTTSHTHELAEVVEALPSARITAAHVFSIRPGEDGPSVYTEPVAVIEGPAGLLGDIRMLGDAFRQERFTIENFDTGTAHVVETRFCTEPD